MCDDNEYDNDDNDNGNQCEPNIQKNEQRLLGHAA
jgi:hypothetical protein